MNEEFVDDQAAYLTEETIPTFRVWSAAGAMKSKRSLKESGRGHAARKWKLRELVAGCGTSRIARALGLNVKTVVEIFDHFLMEEMVRWHFASEALKDPTVLPNTKEPFCSAKPTDIHLSVINGGLVIVEAQDPKMFSPLEGKNWFPVARLAGNSKKIPTKYMLLSTERKDGKNMRFTKEAIEGGVDKVICHLKENPQSVRSVNLQLVLRTVAKEVLGKLETMKRAKKYIEAAKSQPAQEMAQ
ncbi:MAG: hypothetical protein HQL72_14045 [Magnetococcales bacterium]|nr:hypothetical protein [Magnetococcales bacterium]